jgi:t-SNARE complex subunit (syntaxin)
MEYFFKMCKMPITSIIKIIGESMNTRTIQQSLATQQPNSEHMIMTERYHDIGVVVDKVEELHKLQLELQNIVRDQGSVVDKIEQHVTKAGQNIGVGIKDLEQAAINQRGCTLL